MSGSDSIIPKDIRLLLVEDSEAIVQLIENYLDLANETYFRLEHASSLAAAIQRVQGKNIDVVLLDLGLSDSDGLRTFTTLHKYVPDVPIIIFSGYDDKQMAIEALSLGAKDFLVKSKVDSDTLVRSLYYTLERKRVEKQLKQSDERYRMIVDNMGEGLGIVDFEERFKFANTAADDIFGVDEGALIGKCLSEFLDDQNLALVKSQTKDRKTGTKSTYEHEFIRADGQRRHLLVTATPLQNDRQEMTGTLGIFRDITQRKRLEEDLIKSDIELRTATAQLIQSEKLAAMGELAASVAHELNQPLNSIKMTAQSIMRYLKDYGEKELRNDLTDITSTVDSMSKIIDHMRTFARKSMTVELIDINRILARTLEFVEKKCQYHNIEFVKSLSEMPPWVQGDPTQIEQIVLSITNNARAALEDCDTENKKIEFKTFYMTDKEAGIPVVVLEISDNGVGIPDDIKQKILEPFFTTKRRGKGTGLGLSVAAKIIKDHNGTIEIESIEGKGTVIQVRLPAA